MAEVLSEKWKERKAKRGAKIADSTDSDNINIGNLDDKETENEINMMKDHYYAVFYDGQYYIGRTIEFESYRMYC